MTDTLTDIHVLIEAPYKIIQYSTDVVVRDWNSIGQKHKKENNTLVGYVPRVYTGWTSTDVSQYIDRDVNGSVSAEAYRLNTGQLPVVVYWSTVGPLSVASWEIVDR